VAEEVGIPVVVMGDVIRAECRRRRLDPAEHHGRMAGTLREEEGDDAIATRTLPLIRGRRRPTASATPCSSTGSARPSNWSASGRRSATTSRSWRSALLLRIRAERLDDRGRDESDSDLEALRDARRPRDRTRPRRNARTGRCRDRQHRDAGGVPGTRREVLGVAEGEGNADEVADADPATPNAGGDGS